MSLEGIILGLFVLFLAGVFFTNTGRSALIRLLNRGGAEFKMRTEGLDTAESLKTELADSVEKEARAKLAWARSAIENADGVINGLEGKVALQKQLATWKSALSLATQHYQRLTSDETPDDKQKELIGEVKGKGEQALEKIKAIESTLEANAEVYAKAEQMMIQAKAVMSAISEEARQQVMKGNYAAATMQLAKAQEGIFKSSSAFASSDAGRALSRLEAAASKAQSSAKAFQAQAEAVPASAEIVERQLRNLGNNTGFEEHVRQQQAAKETEKAG